MLKLSPNRQSTFSISVVSIVPIGIFLSNAAFAQIDAGVLQQQLQREADKERATPTPELLIKKPTKPVVPKAGAQAIEVKAFKITGNTLVTDDQAQEVLKPYTNQKLTLDQIKEAAFAVTQLYTNIGRVAQAVIPPQDVVDGVILIKIIEGKVGGVIIELDKTAPSRLKSDVIRQFIEVNNPEGGYLDLNGLERSLAILNETPGSEVSGELITGDKEATSNIQVNARDTGLFAGRVDASNYGASNTGPAQIVASLNLNNPAGNGDQATFDAIGSEGSVFGQLRYVMPVGYGGWRMSAGISTLDYKSLNSFSPTMSQGTAQTYGLYSTYALERTASSNKTININFENKNYNNQSSGVQTSRYQINNLNAGIIGNNFYQQAYINWGLTATAGHLSINNATQAINDQNGAATQGYFGKLSFNGSVTQPLPIAKTNMMASIYGQLANKNLNSAEQFYLGGPLWRSRISCCSRCNCLT